MEAAMIDTSCGQITRASSRSSTYQKSSHKDAGFLENVDLEIRRTSKDFAAVVGRRGFVDRTGLIKRILSLKQPILVTAPRMFGKSTNLNMVERFTDLPITPTGELIPLETSENFKIFSKVYKFGQLKIKQDKKFFSAHFGQYPVILLDFLNIEVCSFSSDYSFQNSYEFFLVSFRSIVITPLCKKFAFLKSSDSVSSEDKKLLTDICQEKGEIQDLKAFGIVLKQSIEKHFNKSVIVLVGEIDAVLKNIIQLQSISKSDLQKTLTFLSSFLKPLIQKGRGTTALLTGCSKIGGLFTDGITDLLHIPFFSNRPLSAFYYITEDDIINMGKDFTAKDSTIDKIKSWYNGYRIVETNKTVFSIHSVLKTLEDPHLESTDTGFLRPFSGMFLKPFVGDRILKCLADIPIRVDVFGDYELDDVVFLKRMMEIEPDKKLEPARITDRMKNVFLRLLFEEGYFTLADDSMIQSSGNDLMIPTKEFKMEFRQLLKEAMYIQYNVDDFEIRNFITTLIELDGSEDSVGANLQAIVSLIELSRFKPKSMNEVKDLLHHAFFVDDSQVKELQFELDIGKDRLVDIFTILKKSDESTGKDIGSNLRGVIIIIRYGLSQPSPVDAVNTTLFYSYTDVYSTEAFKKKYPVVGDKLIIGLGCTERSCVACYLLNSLNIADRKTVRVLRKGKRQYMNFSSASWGRVST